MAWSAKRKEKLLAIQHKEELAISRYIRIHYNNTLNTEQYNKSYHTMDTGILLIIRDFCKPLLLVNIDAMRYSMYTSWYFSADKTALNKMTKRSPTTHEPNPYALRCVLVGPPFHGKTSLLVSYYTNGFPAGYCPTVFDHYGRTKKHVADGNQWDVNFVDTAPNWEDTARCRTDFYRNADIFVVCLSVYDKSGYHPHGLEMWKDKTVDVMAIRQEVQKLYPTLPCVLIGTRIDLRDDPEKKDECYTTREMEQIAEAWQCDGYAECSALTQLGLTQAMQTVVEKAVESKRGLMSENKKNCIVL